MISYASRTGTLRNITALRAHGWRMLLTPDRDLSPPPLAYGLDNGAWGAFRRGEPFNVAQFEHAVERRGEGADWIVLPDVVAGGLPSLELSASWIPRLRGIAPLLIAVQDGMTPDDVGPLLAPDIGIFLGGSTEWKLAQMRTWGELAAERGVHYHVARVNTERRIRMAHVAGADSIDGSSASRFAVTIPGLDGARRQPDLWAPKKPATPCPAPRAAATERDHACE